MYIDNLIVASVSTISAGVLYYVGSNLLHPNKSKTTPV